MSLSLGRSFRSADPDTAAAFGDAMKQLKRKSDNSISATSGTSRKVDKFALALANSVFVRNGVQAEPNLPG